MWLLNGLLTGKGLSNWDSKGLPVTPVKAASRGQLIGVYGDESSWLVEFLIKSPLHRHPPKIHTCRQSSFCTVEQEGL